MLHQPGEFHQRIIQRSQIHRRLAAHAAAAKAAAAVASQGKA